MRAENFDIQKVIDHLNGSSETLDNAVEALYPGMDWGDLTDEDHSAIDNEIFLCDECGWWDEISSSCNKTDDCSNGHCENCCTEEDDEDY